MACCEIFWCSGICVCVCTW